TSAWSTNEPVPDTYSLTIPADAAAGSYQLITGLYTAAGRLPLRSGAPSDALPSGEEGAATAGADYVVLGSIQVAP
ncbi:MAG TPA: hypothetical protein VER55_05960, partial [Ardenticatenaceae bacterium]|nr:hypothetical protein [Ardenticatenaceae bacterium]